MQHSYSNNFCINYLHHFYIFLKDMQFYNHCQCPNNSKLLILRFYIFDKLILNYFISISNNFKILIYIIFFNHKRIMFLVNINRNNSLLYIFYYMLKKDLYIQRIFNHTICKYYQLYFHKIHFHINQYMLYHLGIKFLYMMYNLIFNQDKQHNCLDISHMYLLMNSKSIHLDKLFLKKQ